MIDDRRNSWGFALFADDLRAEIGGKLSLMGLYQTDYIFQGTFPLLVPKLVILVLYYEIKDTITDDFIFRVFLPGDADDKPTIEMPMLRSEIPRVELPDDIKLEEGQEPLFHIRIPILLSPLVLKEPGLIKVRARYNDGRILRLGVLNIKAIEPSSQPNQPVEKS